MMNSGRKLRKIASNIGIPLLGEVCDLVVAK
jgi:hypothetical protein